MDHSGPSVLLSLLLSVAVHGLPRVSKITLVTVTEWHPTRLMVTEGPRALPRTLLWLRRVTSPLRCHGRAARELANGSPGECCAMDHVAEP